MTGRLFSHQYEQSGVLSVLPQQNKISGTVTDKDGGPLPGVNVVVTGTTTGTITDIRRQLQY